MVSHTLKRWTRQEYHTLADVGIIKPEERLELVDGQIVEKMTHNPPHAVALTLIQQWLVSSIGQDSHLRIQLPIGLSDLSEPEPDLVVAAGHPRDYFKAHPEPSQIELLVEVSDSSLDRDRRVKAPLYAAAGVREFWILDITSRKLEMHREPGPSGYRVVTILAESENAAAQFQREKQIAISELLPPIS